ncbi:MAG: sugar phosphate isomerase/epimerase family protein [Planctomycetota bacterium]
MRLGGPVKSEDPESWVQVHKKLGYRAAYCPVGADAADDLVNEYVDAADDLVNEYVGAAAEADIVIAEVGAWSNPISPDDEVRKKALDKCRRQLALADRIGARCCVNISGSRGEKWDGPDAKNLTEETFDLIVETIRGIIDEVRPKRTYFTLETMPWAFPDSADSYVRLIAAIDRKQFAVHLDPVNLINSPRRYFNSGQVIRECFSKLLGGLDYETFLKELSKLGDTPLMLEHLANQEQYRQAADHIRGVAEKIGLSFGRDPVGG